MLRKIAAVTAGLGAALAAGAIPAAVGRTGSAPPTQPSMLPAGAILFRSGRSTDGSIVLHATEARSSRLKDLGLRVGWDAHWSPDGRLIGLARSAPGSLPNQEFVDFYIVRADGSRMRRIVRADVTNLSFFERGQFAWSPDGRRIVFTHSVGGRSALSVIGVNGRGRRRLTSPANADDTRPVWSPDGKRIAFVRDGGGCGRPTGICGGLFVVSAEGKRVLRLPTGSTDGVVGGPTWSPDGKRLAFALCCDRGAYIVDVVSNRLRAIARSGTWLGVSWAPNGKLIALAGYGTTYVVRPDGSGYRKIGEVGNSTPSWSPDSKAVVVEDRCCEPDVSVIAVDGSGQRRLTSGWRYGYGNYAPEWNPRGLALGRLGGTNVSPANPTDSVVGNAVLRATHPIYRLSADGLRAAVVYADGKMEAWDAANGPITRFRITYTINETSKAYGSRGFGLAGDRIATTSFSSGGGIDSWRLDSASVDLPRGSPIWVGSPAWPGPCCSTPLEHVEGDGALLVVDGWGACRISLSPPCAHAPKFNGRLYRLSGSGVAQIASDAGALTVLSVDRDRILVDRENGALQLFRADGTPLDAITYGPAQLVGAAIEGDDIVVLTTEGIADYDASTGSLRHQRRVTAPDPREVDVAGGVAAYVSGAEIHVLRLNDGRGVQIRPGGRGPVHAELEPSGLFYSYPVDDAKYPGRVVFVPFDRLSVSAPR